MKIKICGLFRDEDIDYINEARPDYAGFVFAQSRRQISPGKAARLRQRLAEGIAAVGVFVNAAIDDIIALYRDGVISLAQLHGTEDEAYISRIKEKSGAAPIPIIKKLCPLPTPYSPFPTLGSWIKPVSITADYLLMDSGAGSGKTFDWGLLTPGGSCASSLESSGKPWFLAGGVGVDNIEQAITLNPFAIDVSSGAETDGVKSRDKILRLTKIVRKGNIP